VLSSQPISRKTTGATPELLTVPRVSKHSDLRRHSIFGCQIVKERRQAALGFELGHLLLQNLEVATSQEGLLVVVKKFST